MSAGDPLDLLAAHLDAVESMLLDLDGPLPAAPDLGGAVVEAADLEAARELQRRLDQLTGRVEGMQRRLEGEIASLPRARRDTRRRAPRTVDVSA